MNSLEGEIVDTYRTGSLDMKNTFGFIKTVIDVCKIG
jgi:hypothetical protein